MASTKLTMSVTVTDGTKETVHKDVTVIMADMARWDITRPREQWAKSEDAPVLYSMVLAYFALVRTGKIPADTKVHAFLDTVVSVDMNEDEEAAEFPAK
ncbi:hypothetical protein [Arthrobacter sp. BF1]|uniref:hypothetical protein n=1 Tax=Arthrobacter sp. BF1 TaxID=2821145 RepID=UPI001C4F8707|nr:hypothetical protein [Arthrobacter sp. BF1]